MPQGLQTPQGPFPITALWCTHRHRRLPVLTPPCEAGTPLLPAASLPVSQGTGEGGVVGRAEEPT